MMYIPNQLIGAPVDTQVCPRLICDSGMSPVILKVTVECTTEASPKAITYWVFKVGFKICLLKKGVLGEILMNTQGCVYHLLGVH